MLVVSVCLSCLLCVLRSSCLLSFDLLYSNIFHLDSYGNVGHENRQEGQDEKWLVSDFIPLDTNL